MKELKKLAKSGSDMSETARELVEMGMQEAASSGFVRDPKAYRFIVTYPQKALMKSMSGNDILKPGKEGFGLYVHIPFCLSRCTFCSRFEKSHEISPGTIDRYLDSLFSEWESVKGLIEPYYRIESVYIGGGTPTVLDNLQTQRVIDKFVSGLDLVSDAEITWEMSPETATHDRVSSLIDGGVNRLSMGVQDFDDNILKQIGRLHDSQKAKDIVEMVRDMGFENLNLDFIHGLSGQTIESRKRTVEEIIDIEPDSVTDYPLYVCRQSPISRKPDDSFPKHWESMVMAHQATKSLEREGFIHEPVHWFSKKCGHKQQKRKYRNGQIVGLGMSSYGYYAGVQYHNTPDMREYMKMTKRGLSPVKEGIKLTKDMKKARYMVFGMKYGHINKMEYQRIFGSEIKDAYSEILEMLKSLNLVYEDLENIGLTCLGKLLSEEVSVLFTDKKTEKLQKMKGCGKYGDY